MSKRPVVVAACEGWSFSALQLVGLGPKWDLRCGACDIDFRVRLPMKDRPRVACPHCGRVNIVPVEVER